MEAIGSKYLNKNNILTTRYFNNNTIYLDTIKSSDGMTTINVKDILSNNEIDEIKEKMKETNIYIDDIRDDVSQLSTLNTTNMNEINNLTSQLISLSSLVNETLYSPLYFNEETIIKMNGLKSYINDKINNIPKGITENNKVINGIIVKQIINYGNEEVKFESVVPFTNFNHHFYYDDKTYNLKQNNLFISFGRKSIDCSAIMKYCCNSNSSDEYVYTYSNKNYYVAEIYYVFNQTKSNEYEISLCHINLDGSYNKIKTFDKIKVSDLVQEREETIDETEYILPSLPKLTV
ncbi:hypothetical protein EDI_176000 [Entamoeba dispar SAW760]|uniref:Uncharacterized protein n=1 Tax=Entamoeba dispar (strain ATCC PRA-260 / SAW760) TaxID=370354 RepID=B0ELJ9_ENTDS|nr:uncharacterized protein EDI_176000 [Entamoeba dispar SAW760]XP_001739133.1 uncharacterized protein EDI_114320 [Entamoeba dispar SAW760]EDR24493.1 hypothetical protein EDI_114320 [Entamoeba dispar SAW760]EDR24601.1 hypothetical protein EDI_176000 [Entamoeba dispar SAW760]|eukprot:EDR24493.1 hypothetical protein EDI_114320 [Entamoeba dispar SAW760]